MSLFDDAASAPLTGAGKYFYPGRFVVRIRAVLTHESRNPMKQGITFFIVECEIVEAEHSERLKVGDIVSWRPAMNDKNQPNGPQNVKNFCLAGGRTLYANFAEEDLTGAKIKEFCAEDQPLVGELICADAIEITTKAGNPFTLVTWSRFEEAAPGEEAAPN